MLRHENDVKVEAVRRMKKLRLHENVIKDFEGCEESGFEKVLNKSTGSGWLYWLSEDEQKIVADFEKHYPGYCVYHVIHCIVNDMEMYNLLYVNPDDEEWELDSDNSDCNIALCYVYNKQYPLWSEFGEIGFGTAFGGLYRSW